MKIIKTTIAAIIISTAFLSAPMVQACEGDSVPLYWPSIA